MATMEELTAGCEMCQIQVALNTALQREIADQKKHIAELAESLCQANAASNKHKEKADQLKQLLQHEQQRITELEMQAKRDADIIYSHVENCPQGELKKHIALLEERLDYRENELRQVKESWNKTGDRLYDVGASRTRAFEKLLDPQLTHEEARRFVEREVEADK